MVSLRNISPVTGKVAASISVSLEAASKMKREDLTKGIWLLRVPSPVQHSAPGVYAAEAILLDTFRNTGKFQYNSGMTVSVNLASDRILGKIKKSTGFNGVFSVKDISPSNVIYWNSYADFRVWEESEYTFEDIPLEAIKIFDIRKGSGMKPIYHPKYPRFEVGEIALTSYEPVPSDSVPGIEYGYVRIERITMQNEVIGQNKLPLVTYTVRRSYKGISVEEWNHFSKVRDYVQGKIETMSKLSSSVQLRIRNHLFDPYYR